MKFLLFNFYLKVLLQWMDVLKPVYMLSNLPVCQKSYQIPKVLIVCGYIGTIHRKLMFFY